MNVCLITARVYYGLSVIPARMLAHSPRAVSAKESFQITCVTAVTVSPRGQP
jgi:hypothetical protein